MDKLFGYLFSAPELLDFLSPVFAGTVIPWSGDTPPYRFLFCDGKEYKCVDYQNLYSNILNKFGQGVGQDSFKVPYFETLWPEVNLIIMY